MNSQLVNCEQTAREFCRSAMKTAETVGWPQHPVSNQSLKFGGNSTVEWIPVLGKVATKSGTKVQNCSSIMKPVRLTSW